MSDNSAASTPAATHAGARWVPYAGLLVLTWGVWGAFSGTPTSKYDYPNEMVYILWSFTMLIPAYFAMRGQKLDRRPAAAGYGLLIGLTGAGGQLLLFKALTMGPASLIFPIISISPAITVLMAVVILRERIRGLATIGVIAALVSIVLFSVSSDTANVDSGSWLILALIIMVAWGVQAYFMKKAANIGVNDATTFGWMTISGLLLIPVAWIMMGDFPGDAPWQAPALTLGTQLLNAVGALFLVMALSRGKATIVAPVTNAMAPVLTIVLSLAVYQTVPTVFAIVGIILADVGETPRGWRRLPVRSGGVLAVFPPQPREGRGELVVAEAARGGAVVDGGGAVGVHQAPQAVGGAPEPGSGGELDDPVAEVGLGPMSASGERGGVVVAGLPRWPLGLVRGGVVQVDPASTDPGEGGGGREGLGG